MSFRKVAEDRAGRLVARWRTAWGKWVDHWSQYCPGKSAAKVHADVPGLCTRLALAKDIADEIEAALIDQENGFDQIKDRKEKPMAMQKLPEAVSRKEQAWRDRVNEVTARMAEIDLKLKGIDLKRAEIALQMDEARLKDFTSLTRKK
jgi:hypothetical protein